MPGVSAGSRESPQSLNHDFSLLVGGRLHAFGEGLSIFWGLRIAPCCDGPQERAVLVTHSLVLAGEGEQWLLPEQLLWENIRSLRELHSSRRSTTCPQGNHLDQVCSYSVHSLFFFSKDCWIEHSKFENAKMKVAWATALHWMRKWSCETNIKWSCN